jgi:hypothetical protein
MQTDLKSVDEQVNIFNMIELVDGAGGKTGWRMIIPRLINPNLVVAPHIIVDRG